jgi:hypothetical protein
LGSQLWCVFLPVYIDGVLYGSFYQLMLSVGENGD